MNFTGPSSLYGLSGWPGAGFGNDFGYSTGGTVFNGEHRWENNFSMADMGDTTAEERKIMQIKNNADFNRQLAAAHPDKSAQYLAGAAKMDKQYEEAMAAYKAKTAPPTPPGSMVKAEA